MMAVVVLVLYLWLPAIVPFIYLCSPAIVPFVSCRFLKPHPIGEVLLKF
jgi:hypothetical protein